MNERAEYAKKLKLITNGDDIIPIPRAMTHQLNNSFGDIFPNDIMENLDKDIKSNSCFIDIKDKVLSLKTGILSQGINLQEVKGRAIYDHYNQFLILFLAQWTRDKLNKTIPDIIIDIIGIYSSYGINYEASLGNYNFNNNIFQMNQHHYDYKYCHEYAAVVVSLMIHYRLLKKEHIKYNEFRKIIYVRVGRILLNEFQFEYNSKKDIQNLRKCDFEELVKKCRNGELSLIPVSEDSLSRNIINIRTYLCPVIETHSSLYSPDYSNIDETYFWILSYFDYLTYSKSIYCDSYPLPQISCAINYDIRINESFKDEPDNHLFEIAHIDNNGFSRLTITSIYTEEIKQYQRLIAKKWQRWNAKKLELELKIKQEKEKRDQLNDKYEIKKKDKVIKRLNKKKKDRIEKIRELWNFIKEGSNGTAPVQFKSHYYVLPKNGGYGVIKTIISKNQISSTILEKEIKIAVNAGYSDQMPIFNHGYCDFDAVSINSINDQTMIGVNDLSQAIISNINHETITNKYVTILEIKKEHEDIDLIPTKSRHHHWFMDLPLKVRYFVNYIYIILYDSYALYHKFMVNSIMTMCNVVCIVGNWNGIFIDCIHKKIFICIGGYDLSLLLSFDKIKKMLNEIFNGSFIVLQDVDLLERKRKFHLYFKEYEIMESKTKRRRISINIPNRSKTKRSINMKPRRCSTTSIPVSPENAKIIRMNMLLNNQQKNEELLDLQSIDKEEEVKHGTFYDKINSLFDNINVNTNDFNCSKKMGTKWLLKKWEIVEISNNYSNDIIQRYKDNQFAQVFKIDMSVLINLSEHMIIK